KTISAFTVPSCFRSATMWRMITGEPRPPAGARFSSIAAARNVRRRCTQSPRSRNCQPKCLSRCSFRHAVGGLSHLVQPLPGRVSQSVGQAAPAPLAFGVTGCVHAGGGAEAEEVLERNNGQCGGRRQGEAD